MGHLLVVAKQLLVNQECRNTFWIGGNDAVMANAQAIIDALAAAWEDNLQAEFVDDWSLYAFDVYDKTIPSVPGIEYIPTGGGLTGATSNQPLPAQIAGLVTFKAQVTPPNTNRKYLCGFQVGHMAAGILNSTIVTKMEAWAADVLDIPTTTSLAITLEVVALNPDGTVNGSNPLEYALVRSNPATQRRRRIGVGI